MGRARENGVNDEDIMEAIEEGKKIRAGSAARMDKYIPKIVKQ